MLEKVYLAPDSYKNKINNIWIIFFLITKWITKEPINVNIPLVFLETIFLDK